jgi:hypothetical protein
VHFQTDLIPISRFQADELSEAIDEMQLLLDEDMQDRSRDIELEGFMEDMEAMALGEQDTSNNEVYNELDAPRFSTVNFSDTEFICHWSQGLPAVVSPAHFQGNWDPQYFIVAYGDDPVILEDCETGLTRPDTVAGFFETFLTPGDRRIIWKIKASSFQFSAYSWIHSSYTTQRIGLPWNILPPLFQNSLNPSHDVLLAHIFRC